MSRSSCLTCSCSTTAWNWNIVRHWRPIARNMPSCSRRRTVKSQTCRVSVMEGWKDTRQRKDWRTEFRRGQCFFYSPPKCLQILWEHFCMSVCSALAPLYLNWSTVLPQGGGAGTRAVLKLARCPEIALRGGERCRAGYQAASPCEGSHWGSHVVFLCRNTHRKSLWLLGLANALIRLQLHGQCRVTEERSFLFFYSPMGDCVTLGLATLWVLWGSETPALLYCMGHPWLLSTPARWWRYFKSLIDFCWLLTLTAAATYLICVEFV